MYALIFLIYAMIYFALLCSGIILAQKHKWLTSANVLLFVIGAFIYDNTILAIGRFIGEGNILKNLNEARFWFHGLFTPLLVIFAWNTLSRAHISWAGKKGVRYAAYVLMIGLIILEISTQVVGIQLEAKWVHGILSYENSKETGPPFMVITVTAILLVSSLVIWRKQRWPWFFLGIITMTVGSVLSIWIQDMAFTNLFELLLMASLLATKHDQDKVL